MKNSSSKRVCCKLVVVKYLLSAPKVYTYKCLPCYRPGLKCCQRDIDDIDVPVNQF